MSSSTSRSFKEHVFTRKRLSLEQKNQEEDFPDAAALLIARRDVCDGKNTSGRNATAPARLCVFSARESSASVDTSSAAETYAAV